MAVGADQGVGIGHGDAVGFTGPHHLGEIFEVDLVADAGPRRHHPEVIEGLLTPTKELVTFAVALEFDTDVLCERVGTAELIDHHRVVDHQVYRHQWIDLRRIGAAGDHRVAHRGKVDDRGNAGEILHQHPCRSIGDFPVRAPCLQPRGDRVDIVDTDGAAILPTEQVLEQHLERIRQLRDVAKSGSAGCEAEIFVALAANGQRAARL